MSMLSNPVFNRFHVYLSPRFIPTEIEDKFMPWFERQTPCFESIVEYINDSINGIEVPGISTQVMTQVSKDGSKRQFAGSLSAHSSMKYSITLNFKIRNNYFTYFVLRSLLTEYIDRKSKSEEFFLPHITLDIIDPYGYVIFRQHYHEVVFESISSITLKKNEFGFSYKEFSCTFKYNRLDEVAPIETSTPMTFDDEFIY